MHALRLTLPVVTLVLAGGVFAVAGSVVGSVVGCGPARPPEGPAGPKTRFREGDFVVYRYTGTYTKEPVVLREQILAQDGLVLRIGVSVRRGIDERKWVQVVTDTPDNRKGNVVDALYLDDHGNLRRLDNKKNADLYALYEWTYLVPDGKPLTVVDGKREVTLQGARFECDVHGGKTKVQGRIVSFEEVECPEFLWTHAGARFWDEGTGEELYKADVVAFGHK